MKKGLVSFVAGVAVGVGLGAGFVAPNFATERQEHYFVKCMDLEKNFHEEKVKESKKVKADELWNTIETGKQYQMCSATAPTYGKKGFAVHMNGEVVDLSGDGYLKVVENMKKGDRYELLLEGMSLYDGSFSEITKAMDYLWMKNPKQARHIYFMQGVRKDETAVQKAAREKIFTEYPTVRYVQNLKYDYWGER